MAFRYSKTRRSRSAPKRAISKRSAGYAKKYSGGARRSGSQTIRIEVVGANTGTASFPVGVGLMAQPRANGPVKPTF